MFLCDPYIMHVCVCLVSILYREVQDEDLERIARSQRQVLEADGRVSCSKICLALSKKKKTMCPLPFLFCFSFTEGQVGNIVCRLMPRKRGSAKVRADIVPSSRGSRILAPSMAADRQCSLAAEESQLLPFGGCVQGDDLFSCLNSQLALWCCCHVLLHVTLWLCNLFPIFCLLGLLWQCRSVDGVCYCQSPAEAQCSVGGSRSAPSAASSLLPPG